MAISLLGLVYFIAFAQAVMMISVLYKASDKNQPGRILLLLLAVMAYKLLEGGLLNSDLYQFVPHLIDWLAGAALLIGPIFYAYISRMSGEPVWSHAKWLLHLSPFLLLLMFQMPQLLVSAQQKLAQIEYYQNNNSYGVLPLFILLLLVSIKLHLASYLWTSWKSLQSSEIKALQQTADDAFWCLSWQKKLCLMLMALELLWVVLFLGQQFWNLSILNAVGEYWLLLMSAVVLMMGYWGLQKPQLILDQVFQNNTAKNDKTPLPDSAKTSAAQEKYQNSALEDSTADSIAKAVYQAMEKEQLYLDSTLNLSMLSDHLGIRRHLVSQVITQTMKTTFFKLVNSYRVAYAKSLIDNPDLAFTLERIAIESGFNNRVTFNKAFKEEEGESPSIYRKALKLAS